MSPSGFFTAFLAILLVAKGEPKVQSFNSEIFDSFSYPQKNEDYPGDDDLPGGDEDEFAGDSDTVNELEANKKPSRILSRGATVEEEIGKTIYLPCNTDADDPVISWKKGELHLFFGTTAVEKLETREISVSGNHTLVIKNAQESDSGLYTCVLNEQANNNPEIVYSVIISKKPPRLLVYPAQHVNINEKESVELSCRVSDGPSPTKITWMHDSDQVSKQSNVRESKFYIKNASRHNAGIYQCLADFQNDKLPLHNVVNVTVSYSPEVEVTSDYVHGGVGQTAILTCVVHAHPKAVVNWHKIVGSEQKHIASSEHSKIENGKYIHHLTLKNVQKGDFGKYLCSATNDFGSHSKGLELTGAPAIARFREGELKDDKTIVMKWEVESYAPIKKYEVRYCKVEKDNTISKWLKAEPKVIPGDGSQLYIAEFVAKDLEPSLYHFQIRSMNAFGWSQFSMAQSIDGQYRLMTAGIGGGASATQPIMFLTALLLVFSCFVFKNL